MSTRKMVSDLTHLDDHANVSPRYGANAANHFNGVRRFTALLSTHPTIDKRIDYLQRQQFQQARNEKELPV